MQRRPAPTSQNVSRTDPHGDNAPREQAGRHDASEDADARGGQFFGTPGEYGRQQGWLDGHLVGRERSTRVPATGYDDARHGRRQAGVYGGTGPFAWPGRPDTGRTGGEDDAFDPHYRRWRQEQEHALDDDYRAYQGDRYQRFSREFGAWRTARALMKGPTSQPGADGQPEGGQLHGDQHGDPRQGQGGGQPDDAAARRHR